MKEIGQNWKCYPCRQRMPTFHILGNCIVIKLVYVEGYILKSHLVEFTGTQKARLINGNEIISKTDYNTTGPLVAFRGLPKETTPFPSGDNVLGQFCWSQQLTSTRLAPRRWTSEAWAKIHRESIRIRKMSTFPSIISNLRFTETTGRIRNSSSCKWDEKILASGLLLSCF